MGRSIEKLAVNSIFGVEKSARQSALRENMTELLLNLRFWTHLVFCTLLTRRCSWQDWSEKRGVA